MQAIQPLPDRRVSSAVPRPVTIPLWTQPERAPVMLLALGAGVAFIAALTYALPPGRASVLVLDRPSMHFPYPFTIQNFLHLIFFVGLGELFVRWRTGSREEALLHAGYLPEDDRTVLNENELGPYRRRVLGEFDHEHGFLPLLINLTALQF
jgi:hypothetical protein